MTREYLIEFRDDDGQWHRGHRRFDSKEVAEEAARRCENAVGLRYRVVEAECIKS